MAKGMARKKKIPLDEVDDYLAVNDPIILQTEPEKIAKIGLGKRVLVTLPNHSKMYRYVARKQFDEHLVSVYGNIKLNDGQELVPGKTYEMELTREVKEFLVNGALKGGGKPRF
jgi:hypothetical protein